MSETDMDIVMADMNALKATGADGFVFGALTETRDIDEGACRTIIQNAGNLPVTFHRAFDMTSPPMSNVNLEKIARLGFKRLLSSGFSETAEIGIDELVDMHDCIRGEQLDLILMPGCGVTFDNMEEILITTECQEIHASAKTKLTEDIPKLSEEDTYAIEQAIETNSYYETDAGTVEEMVLIVDTVAKIE